MSLLGTFLVVTLICSVCAQNDNVWTVDKGSTSDMNLKGIIFFHETHDEKSKTEDHINSNIRENHRISSSSNSSDDSTIDRIRGGKQNLYTFSNVLPDQKKLSQIVGLTNVANSRLKQVDSNVPGSLGTNTQQKINTAKAASFDSFVPIGDSFEPQTSELVVSNMNNDLAGDSAANSFDSWNFGSSNADNQVKQNIDFSSLGISNDNIVNDYVFTTVGPTLGSQSIFKKSNTFPNFLATDSGSQGSLFDSTNSLSSAVLDNSALLRRDPITPTTNKLGNQFGSALPTPFMEPTITSAGLGIDNNFYRFDDFKTSSSSINIGTVPEIGQSQEIADTNKRTPTMLAKETFVDNSRRPVLRVKSAFVDMSGRQTPNMKPIGNFLEASDLDKTTNFLTQIATQSSTSVEKAEKLRPTQIPVITGIASPNQNDLNIKPQPPTVLTTTVAKPNLVIPTTSSSSSSTFNGDINKNTNINIPAAITNINNNNIIPNRKPLNGKDNFLIANDIQRQEDNLKVDLLYPPAPFPSSDQSNSIQVSNSQSNSNTILNQNRNDNSNSMNVVKADVANTNTDSNGMSGNQEDILGVTDYDMYEDFVNEPTNPPVSASSVNNQLPKSTISSGTMHTPLRPSQNINTDSFITEPNVQILNPNTRNTGQRNFPGNGQVTNPFSGQANINANAQINGRPMGETIKSPIGQTQSITNTPVNDQINSPTNGQINTNSNGQPNIATLGQINSPINSQVKRQANGQMNFQTNGQTNIGTNGQINGPMRNNFNSISQISQTVNGQQVVPVNVQSQATMGGQMDGPGSFQTNRFNMQNIGVNSQQTNFNSPILQNGQTLSNNGQTSLNGHTVPGSNFGGSVSQGGLNSLNSFQNSLGNQNNFQTNRNDPTLINNGVNLLSNGPNTVDQFNNVFQPGQTNSNNLQNLQNNPTIFPNNNNVLQGNQMNSQQPNSRNFNRDLNSVQGNVNNPQPPQDLPAFDGNFQQDDNNIFNNFDSRFRVQDDVSQFDGNSQFTGNVGQFPGLATTSTGNLPQFPGNTPSFPGNSQSFPGNAQSLSGNLPSLPGNSLSFPGNSAQLPVNSMQSNGFVPQFQGNAPQLNANVPQFVDNAQSTIANGGNQNPNQVNVPIVNRNNLQQQGNVPQNHNNFQQPTQLNGNTNNIGLPQVNGNSGNTFQSQNFQPNQGPSFTSGSNVPQFQGNLLQTSGNVPPFQGNMPEIQGNMPPFQGNNLQSQGQITQFQGNMPPFQGNMPPFQGNMPSFQGNNLQPEGQITQFQGNMPPFQGNMPPFQGNNLQPEGQITQFQGNNQQTQRNIPQLNGNVQFGQNSGNPFQGQFLQNQNLFQQQIPGLFSNNFQDMAGRLSNNLQNPFLSNNIGPGNFRGNMPFNGNVFTRNG